MRLALLKITLVAFLASSWVFSSFIFATRPGEDAPAQSKTAEALTSIVRLPASLPAQIPGMKAQPKPFEPIAMEIVQVPCWDRTKSAPKATEAHWVRLTGRACDGEVEPEAISVRNITNGFSATIFSTEAKNMTTDFIPLQAGNNEVIISFSQGNGTTMESQVNFLRE